MWKPQPLGKREVLVRVCQTCTEMLHDRGYAITRASVGATPAIVAERVDGGGHVAHVIFHADDKIGVKSMRQMQAEMQSDAVDHLIVVSAEGPTPFTRRELGELHNIEFFRFAELLVNVTKFSIVPRHSLVPDDEVPALKRRYHVASDDQWPKLNRTDAVCRYYHFAPGRLVRIERVFGNAAHLYYRLVT